METMLNRKAVLIYSSSEANFQDTVDQTRRRASDNGIMLDVVDAIQLTSSEEDQFLTNIRTIPPQTRGQVRSGGGRTLPISNSGRLNRLIPILIFYDGPKPVDVYPKDLMGVKYDLDSAFKTPRTTDILGVESSIITIL